MPKSQHYWAVRTSRDNLEFLNNELTGGRLRQGWGWNPDQNLNVIREALKNKQILNSDQLACWRGNRNLHPNEGVQNGDILILPNLPKIGMWQVARVTGDYQFNISLSEKDFGHIRYVASIGSPVNPYNKEVSASLRVTMTCRSRMWSLDWYQKDVEHLVHALENGQDLSQPAKEDEKLSEIYSKMLGNLKDSFKRSFEGKQAEPVFKKILAKAYNIPEMNIENMTGRNDKGADLVCKFKDALGVEHKIAIQVKMAGGPSTWKKALDQIKTFCNDNQFVTAAVIIHMDEVPPDILKEREFIETTLNTPITLLGGEEVTKLVLTYFPVTSNREV